MINKYNIGDMIIVNIPDEINPNQKTAYGRIIKNNRKSYNVHIITNDGHFYMNVSK